MIQLRLRGSQGRECNMNQMMRGWTYLMYAVSRKLQINVMTYFAAQSNMTCLNFDVLKRLET